MESERDIKVKRRKKDAASREFLQASDQHEIVLQIQKIRQEILDFIKILSAF